MRLFHFSDTHLGFSEYNKVDPQTGLNQREQDFYDAWDQVIEAILQPKPDVVVHAGDLFHTSRPTNRAIRVALEGIQKISDAGIPFVVISGNHSTPRIQATGSIFESIALFPNVCAAYQNQYERFTVSGVDFHCVPHCSLSEDLESAFQAVKVHKKAERNVLVTHGAWSGKQVYSMGEFNEQRLPDPEAQLKLRFDYIALGHYHRRVDVKDHACYPGATERTSFNQHDSSTGYLLVDLETGERTYHEVKARPMMKLSPLVCRDLTAPEIYGELEKRSTEVIEGALVSLSLVDLRHETFVKLDTRVIDELFPHAFHLEKQFVQLAAEGEVVAATTAIDSLPVEFERYVENLEVKDLDKERLKKMGAEYLTPE